MLNLHVPFAGDMKKKILQATVQELNSDLLEEPELLCD